MEAVFLLAGKKRCCINGSQKILQILSDLLGHYNKEAGTFFVGFLWFGEFVSQVKSRNQLNNNCNNTCVYQIFCKTVRKSQQFSIRSSVYQEKHFLCQ